MLHKVPTCLSRMQFDGIGGRLDTTSPKAENKGLEKYVPNIFQFYHFLSLVHVEKMNQEIPDDFY